MVKVIIELDGERKELTGDLVMGTVAKFHGDRMEANTFIDGKGSKDSVITLLLNMIPRILEAVFKNEISYLNAMFTLDKELNKKIKSELKENADSVAEMLKDL